MQRSQTETVKRWPLCKRGGEGGTEDCRMQSMRHCIIAWKNGRQASLKSRYKKKICEPYHKHKHRKTPAAAAAAEPIVMEVSRSLPLARIFSRLASAADARSDIQYLKVKPPIHNLRELIR